VRWPAALAAAAALAACTEERDRQLVLWHAYHGDERTTLEAIAARWNAAHADRPLTLVAVPYDAFADKLTSAIPNGNGPDLFIYAHDRIGSWAQARVLEPVEFWVDAGLADRHDRAALRPLAYEGSLWGLPLATKTLALFHRTDLVPSPPRSTDELFARAGAARAAGRYALGYVAADLYGHAPWLHGFGGHVFDDAGEVDLATAEAAAAARFARALVAEHVSPDETSAQQLAALFNEGKVEAAISGPWFVGDLEPGVRWAVAPLPTVSATGAPARPFLTAEAVMMSARAADKAAAFEAMAFLTDDASAIARARDARQVVANHAAYDDPAVAADVVLATFRAQAADTVPMPATPAMRAVWRPYQVALQAALRGEEPGDALREAQREVEERP
jgi:arabinogalactan oligomer/maltooligosaccharide transport system substrate-binding protein